MVIHSLVILSEPRTHMPTGDKVLPARGVTELVPGWLRLYSWTGTDFHLSSDMEGKRTQEDNQSRNVDHMMQETSVSGGVSLLGEVGQELLVSILSIWDREGRRETDRCMVPDNKRGQSHPRQTSWRQRKERHYSPPHLLLLSSPGENPQYRGRTFSCPKGSKQFFRLCQQKHGECSWA